MKKCDECGEYWFPTMCTDGHKCAPCYEVWNEDDDRIDSCNVYAMSGSDAVEKWAEEDDCNSADYNIVSGRDATVMVAAPDGKLAKFIVSGGSVPEYHARFVEGVDDEN